MGNDAGSGGSSDPRTYFEGMSHRTMLQMLVGADNAKVTALADKLSDVATTVEGIGTDLQTHMSGLEWDSAAGDAFRDWGGKVASATFTLSEYSQSASDQMTNVASVLSQAQRDMPPVPQGAVNTAVAYRQSKNLYGPWGDAADSESATACVPEPTAAEYSSAVATMEADRVKAVDAMTKLGSAYQGAADSMTSAEEPKFPPPPNEVMPPRSAVDSREYVPVPSGSSSAGVTTPDSGRTVTAAVPHEVITTSQHGGTTSTLDFSGADPNGHTGTQVPIGVDQGGGTLQSVDPYPLPLPNNALTEYPGEGPGGLPGLGSSPYPEGVIGGRSNSLYRPGDGIQGGQLVEEPPGGAGSRIRFPQGTVIGEEPTVASGGALGSGRLGPSATPAYKGSGEEYTQGGSGLGASREQELGQGRSGTQKMMGGLGNGHGSAGKRRAGERPDYLTEEEETWTPDGLEVVPSVLE
jgi:uncharacterized protein YukE